MKEIVNQQTVIDLKKSRNAMIGSIILSLVITIGGCIPLFLLATREYKYWFAFILAVICTLEASFILYLSVVCIAPLNSYLKLCVASFDKTKFSTKGRVVEVNQKITHYKGIAVREIKVVDLDEENKQYIFYLEQNKEFIFEKDGNYMFVTFQSVITSYEVL